jgi:poly [ADP-ribose] polymerase
LQSDTNPNNCYFFARWGRVGVRGQISNQGPTLSMHAINSYLNKLHEKTRKGEYREVEMNYDEDDEKKDEEKKDEEKDDKIDNKDPDQQTEKKESKLSKPVQSLIELIFDLNMMNQQMFKIGYNVNKMPLGKLSK